MTLTALPNLLTIAAAVPGQEGAVFWNTVRGLLILLATALLLGAVLERLGQSAILGYLIAGTVLGPNAFQIVSQDQSVEAISELGVALLLFTIGLEFSWQRLKRLGMLALVGGSMQVLITGTVAALSCLVLGLATVPAVALGAMVALSSTACVLRMLSDRAEIDSVHGRNALGILLLQDIAVVPLVLLVTVMVIGGTPSEIAWSLAKTLGMAAVLIGGFFIVFNLILPRIMSLRALVQNRDLPVLLAVVMAIGSAWAAHEVQLSPALGAFVAGMLLGESPFAHQIRADVSPMKTLFVTIFFSSIGMLGDLHWALTNWLPVLGVVVALVLGKAAIIWGVLKLMGVTHRHALATGIVLAQVGEFSFVLAKVARDGEILEPDVFNLFVTATIATLFFSPYMVAYGPAIGVRVENWLEKAKIIKPPPALQEGDVAKRSGHVIVVGFGPAGQRVAQALGRGGIDVVVVDLNPHTAHIADEMNLEGHVGNAAQADILEHLHVTTARAVVVAIPDHRAAIQVIRMVRDMSPQAHIVARARYSAYGQDLSQAGAHAVVDEEDQVGRRLGIEARKQVGLSAESSEEPPRQNEMPSI